MFRGLADDDGSVGVTDVQVAGFSAAATRFFAGLERDNSKDYWTANKTVFDKEVKEPMAALVDSLPERFQPFKVFRMNRDIRFSPDKSPYKTQHGAAHETDGTVCYLHVDARGLMAACGAYMMAPDQLERYREAVATDATGRALQGILSDLSERGDRKSTRLNSSHTEIYTLSLHDALPISYMMAPDQLERYREAVATDATGRALQGILSDLSER